MNKLSKIILIILILIFTVNFSNVVNAAEYALPEKDHKLSFHDSSHVAKQLEQYGYTGQCNIVREENESNYREITWDMKATIKLKAEESTSEKGKILYKYSLSINGKFISSSPYAMERTVAESSVKNVLKTNGFDYKGRLSVGTNNIQYTEVAEIKISKWNKDGTKFKYSYGVYGIDKGNNVDVSENKAEGGVKFDENKAIDMNEATRYVEPGSYYYSYNKVMAVMSPVERLTGEEPVKVLKKDETSGYSRIKLNNGTECYIKNENLLLNQADTTKIEEEKQKQKDETKKINAQVGTGTPGGAIAHVDSSIQVTPIEDPTNNANAYYPGDLTTADTSQLIAKAGTILGIIRNIGVALGVVALTAMGLRYMLASVEEKAEYKETMPPYVIGAVILMAGTTLVDVIYSVASNF